ncbi:S-4TM family putative pore-forming effector [Spirillospora sp. CA-253888]
MPQSLPPIPERQNEEALLAHLRAMAVSHARVQLLENLRMLVSVLVATAGLVATFVSSIAPTVTVIGVLWALAYTAGLAGWAGRELKRAALLQEGFDVRLFELPWNSTLAGEQVNPQEVSRLAARYQGGDGPIRDYYEIPHLPSPYDVLACQLQNLGWGARVRRRYADVLVGALVCWVVAGVVTGALTQVTLGQLLTRWYIPALGALLLGLEVARGQRTVAAERERVLTLVRSRIAQGGPDADLLVLARQVQDVLLLTRYRVPRVPDWFFAQFKSADRRDFQAAMDDLVATLQARGVA